MNLSSFKNYIGTCCKAQIELQQFWSKFSKFSAFSLFKIIATKNQPKIDINLIRIFILSFNWQSLLTHSYQIDEPSYKIYSSVLNMKQTQILDYGIELLIKQWGTENSLTFDQFCVLIKGQHQLPNNQKQVPFACKKLLFQLLIHQIQNLIEIQRLKTLVFYTYGNMVDLFQTITSTKCIQQVNIQRLFLSFSQKKSENQIKAACKRTRIPCNFQQFLNYFKRNTKAEKQFKINYSAKRSKDLGTEDKKYTFTTPRKQKSQIAQHSTKLTKADDKNITPSKIQQSQSIRTPKQTSKFNQSEIESSHNQKYYQILYDILETQQQFIDRCSKLVKQKDFDLELVYEQRGHKFQKILNQRYGLCNFSAFVRFIVPRDFEHRYLSFIRYQPQNSLSKETELLIDKLIQGYYQKQEKIKQIWNRCDKQIFLRYFSLPRENSINSSKIRQFFTSRQTKVLLQRLDPHFQGRILLEKLV